jgi:cell division protein ZapA (FtsZ GTPase activity inhibitor)
MAMDETFTINLYIAEKHYPLRIKRSEEELVRKAAKLINDKIAQYRGLYNVEEAGLELRDLLAMAACQIAIEAIKNSEKTDDTAFYKSVMQLNKELEDFLK